jgi:hypothetical protein
MKQTTLRLPDRLAAEAEAVARVKGISVNQLVTDALAAEIDRLRTSKAFSAEAKKALKRDKELLARLPR